MKKKIWVSAAVCAFAAAGILALVIGKDYWEKHEARREYEEMRQQDKEQEIQAQDTDGEDGERGIRAQGQLREETEPGHDAQSGSAGKKLKQIDIPVDFHSLREQNPDRKSVV